VSKIGNLIRQLIWTRRLRAKECTHLDQIQTVMPNTEGCQECLALGDTWVHLRLCLICGHVGCCNDSKNKHATKHFHTTKHPLMKSLEPGEAWLWCFVDETLLSSAFLSESKVNERFSS
jgi:uncharacterized UBP type Zn finger protein